MRNILNGFIECNRDFGSFTEFSERVKISAGKWLFNILNAESFQLFYDPGGFISRPRSICIDSEY